MIITMQGPVEDNSVRKIIHIVYLVPLWRYQYQRSLWNCESVLHILSKLDIHTFQPQAFMFWGYLENISKHEKIE